MTSITVKIDEDVKQNAEMLFNNLGLTVSAAINIFFRQAIRERAIPFPIREKTSEEKYNEYFNPYNMKILSESIAELDAGKGIKMTMADLEALADG